MPAEADEGPGARDSQVGVDSALDTRQSLPSNASAVGRQPREHRWSETYLVGDLSETIDGLGHPCASEKVDEPSPRVVFTGLVCVVRADHRQDVALDPGCCHVLPDVGVFTSVNSSRETPIRVQNNLGPVIEHRVLADTEVRLARRFAIQLAQGPEPNYCHAA
jgi:hypothetical protein